MADKVLVGKLDESKTEKESLSQAVTYGKRILDITEIDEVKIEQYLLAHPVISTGVDKKANRIINRSYIVDGPNKKMSDWCRDILDKSGGEILLKNWIKDGYGFGNGWLYFTYTDEEKPQVSRLRQKHPVFFGYYKEKAKGSGFWGEDKYQIVFDEKTGKPKGFCEWILKEGHRIPKEGSLIPPEKVAHLRFDTWGDELEGTSIVQYANLTIKYVLNIEEAGAEAMYRNGFQVKKFKTNLTSEKSLKEFAKKVANSNDTDNIVLSRDTDVENLVPGKTDFVDFHTEFMKELCIPLRMPRPMITMDGENTNMATLQILTDEMYEDTFADELLIKKVVDDIFSRICKLKFPEASELEYPKFFFKPRPEDVDRALERKNREADIFFKLSQAAMQLTQMGLTEEAKTLVKEFMTKYDLLNTEKKKVNDWGIIARFEKKVDDENRGCS